MTASPAKPPILQRLMRGLRRRLGKAAARGIGARDLEAAAARRSRHLIRALDDLPDARAEPNERLIFDVGMHVGQDTDFYLRKGFGVIAIEANPILAAAAERRFKAALRSGQLKILNIGIGEERGRAEFHVNLELSEWSSFKPATASRGMPTAPVSVNVATIAEVVQKFGTPYYLKIDIEGLDGAAVKGLRDCPKKPRFVSFENGEISLFDVLVSFGYTHFKFINQADVPSLSCPTPAREGNAIAYKFPYGASGPFGEDTPGEWLDADAMRPVLEQHSAARARGNYDAAKEGWFDLHAKLG
ncbi:MAG: FkbM family methyltransferase [Hyphomonadaceae bacterium]